MKPARFVVGIDLGTTNAAVASASLPAPNDPGAPGEVSVFEIAQRTDAQHVARRALLPTALFAEPEADADPEPTFAHWMVGQHAKQRGREVPERAVVSSKSWLSYAKVDRAARILPWGDGPAAKISPIDAAAFVLEHVARAWDDAHPEAPLAAQDVVLTVPASFDQVARELTVQAAKRAGLSVRLLEEPQAAFYAAWRDGVIVAPSVEEAATRVLVCDVGGGTTDLTLLEVRAHADKIDVKRTAVGPHLLLGGDNMDLALAHALEPALTGEAERLSPSRFSALVLAAQAAKETLLGATPAESAPIVLAGEGSSLLRGMAKTTAQRADVEAIVVDGFFPLVTPDEGKKRPRGGLVSFGLPYERDAAVTRHVASFLARHGGGVDALLLNGGVFRAPRIRERIADAILHIAGKPVTVFRESDPDLAVARGAAYFGLAARGLGDRIRAGSPRAYFVGVASTSGSRAVCVVPKEADEGSRHTVDAPLKLTVGRPARFDLFASDTAEGVAVGTVVDAAPLDRLPPLSTVVTASRKTEVDVVLESFMSEVGTLEISLADREHARRFRLAFDLKPATDAPSSPPPRSALHKLDEARERIAAAYADGADGRLAKNLLRELERLLGERPSWSTDVARALADALLGVARARKASADHERTFMLLTGYCMRPGFGAAGDAERMKRVVPLYAERLAFPEARNWQQFFILFRRTAGGIVEATQCKIRDELDGFVAPREANLKKPKGVRPDSTDDLWDLLAHLERVPVVRREALGNWLIERSWTDRDPRIWASLGRIGARVPAYASAHHVVPPRTAESWLDHLLREKWSDLPTAPRAASELARLTLDRARDVGASLRADVQKRLIKENADARLVRVVAEHVEVDASDHASFFGEALPPGLTLVGD